MFWDGERWLPDQPRVVKTPSKLRPALRTRPRGWLASGVAVVAIIGLVIPIVTVSAARWGRANAPREVVRRR